MNEWIKALQAEASEIESPLERMFWVVSGLLGLCWKGAFVNIMQVLLALTLAGFAAFFSLWDTNVFSKYSVVEHTVQRPSEWLSIPIAWLVLVGMGMLARLLNVSWRPLLIGAAGFVPLAHLIDVLTPMTIPFSFDVPEAALALVLMAVGWHISLKNIFRKDGPLYQFASQNRDHLMLAFLLSSTLLTIAKGEMHASLQILLMLGTCIFLGAFYWKNTSVQQLLLRATAFGLLFPVAFYLTVPLYGGFIAFSTWGAWQFPGYFVPQMSIALFMMVIISNLFSRALLFFRSTRTA
ncbi:hypothetical protein [Deinococcus misasensis]|uniref:hypothetical protein n=1 Tax=Deinococcus misasensis TaxID=392413 RepID=UPI00054F8931|nr:hypothetical protein [Deinococcus misasensis]